MSPGVTYAVPNGFYGARPIYFDDPPYELAREAARSWLTDPEGIHGMQSEFAGWGLTPTRVTVPPWDVPDPWTLPAVTTGYSDPNDIVGSWGVVEADGGLSYNVHRGGFLTPRIPSVGAPSPALLAMGPYKLTDFRITAPPPVVLPAPGTPPAPAQTPTGPAGNPITGNPADRYLVNGVLYDGRGAVIQTVTSSSAPARQSSYALLALVVGVVYALTHTR